MGSEGNCMLKDKLANNSLTCDSEGNCMLKDKLFKIGGSYKGMSASMSTADNALTCDSEGNCMLKDKLINWKSIGNSVANVAGGHILPAVTSYATGGLVKAKITVADNALTCDSEGNCMLKDKLMTEGKAADKGNFYNGEGT